MLINEILHRIAESNDDAHFALRQLLIASDTPNDELIADDRSPLPTPYFDMMRSAIELLESDEYARDDLSTLLMIFSLCPLHRIDFAICFDDDDPDCAQIRTAFPYSHDT